MDDERRCEGVAWFASLESCDVSHAKVVKSLTHYYKHVTTLSAYLTQALPHLSDTVVPHVELKDILRCGQIAFDHDNIPGFVVPEDAPVDIADVVHRSQSLILQRQDYRHSSKDLLTMGLRKADDRADVVTVIGSTAVQEMNVNERVTQLMTKPCWHALAQFVGAQVMEHLLVCTSLFIPLRESSSNYVQMWGLNLGSAVVPATLPDLVTDLTSSQTHLKRSRKRKRRPESTAPTSLKNAKTFPIQLANADLQRSRLFYAKVQHYRSGTLVSGLPVRHMLNRVVHTDYDDDMSAARCLAKYIWPEEYGLTAQWTTTGSKVEAIDRNRRVTSSQRDVGVEQFRRVRTPKRLGKAVRLLVVMLRKHRRFDYRRALDLCCSSKLPRRRMSQSERQMLLVDLCEVGATQSQFVTQMCKNDHDLIPRTQTKVKPERPRFAKYKMPYGSIARYVRLVIQSVIPIEIFGSAYNRSVVLRACERFISARRCETMTMHEVCQGFRVLDCEWSSARSPGACRQRCTQSDMTKRHGLVRSFLFWIFNDFLLPLLRTNFYATESAKYRNRVLYFRQHDWHAIAQPILESLKDQCFERVEKMKAVSIMSRRDFGYSFVRLLPKEVGMRPIVNLRRRSVKIDRHPGPNVAPRDILRGDETGKGWGQIVRQKHSINAILAQLFQVLKCERESDGDDLGSTVSGATDIFECLSDLKERLQRKHPGSAPPPLFFVKVDVAGAFDSIDQTKLLAIVDDVIRSERYVSQRYVRITSSAARPIRSWPRMAFAEEMHEPFDQFADRLTALQHLRDTILVDAGNAAHCERSELMDLLYEHISNNLIKIGKEFCRQRVGIPQGSTLSTLLCNYYLARMEQELGLRSTSDDQESLLMRYTDDFLFISTSVHAARHFFETVQRRSAEFNCVIAADKSLCNFTMLHADTGADLAVEAASVVQMIAPPSGGAIKFPWCGYQIDTATLAVQHDWQRYSSTCVADTLTVPCRRPFAVLVANVIGVSVQRRNLQVYLNCSLNGLDGVLSNVYQAFQVAGLKLIAAFLAVRSRFPRPGQGKKDRSQDLLLRYVLESIEHCYAHACAKMGREEPASAWSAHVTSATYRWLAVDAVQRSFAFRPATRRLGVCASLSAHRRYLQQRLRAEDDIRRLRRIAAETWRETGPVVRTMALQ